MKTLQHSRLLTLLTLSSLSTLIPTPARAQTSLTPESGMAYSANAGWIDPKAGSGQHGLIIGQCVCTGYLYSANCGWINMGSGVPANGVQYANNTGSDFGVNRLPDGRLRGYAWGASIGWISFENTGDPYIAPTRQLRGYAWSANLGWISLSNLSGGIFQQNTDADGDGLPDAWESEWSSSGFLTATGDLDGDGAGDADEYAAGTDPTESYDKLDLTTFFENTSTVSIGWKSVPNRYYRVLTSSDLVTWNYANFFVIPPASPLITKGSAGATTTRLVVKPAGTRAFFKVIALKPPAQP